MLEHPDITRIEATGHPHTKDNAVYHCEDCGDPIPEGEPYYEINGSILCPNCMEEMKHYA